MSNVNSLYPPVVDTYNPSFVASAGTRVIDGETKDVRKGYCKIYFSLSPYNKKEDIKSIWVSIVNPKTNKTVLNISTEVKRFTADQMMLDPTSSETNPKYYVRLGSGWLKGYSWSLSTTYKIQVRFCGDENVTNTSASINANIDSFSEWSTATLVKPIAGYKTTLYKMGWTDKDKNTFNVYQNLISGKVSYLSSDSKGEYLDSFRIKIYTASKNWVKQEIVYDSGICYTDEFSPGEFKHYLTKGFAEGKYIFSMTFTSNNLFTYTNNYPVTILDRGKGSLYATIAATPEPENGRIKLTITTPARKEYVGNFVLRRSSSETNFTYWEDLKVLQLKVPNSAVAQKIDWFDYTADSGIFYKYYLTRLYETSENQYASFTEPVMMLLNDIFINGDGRQLKIKFDPSISSYQHTLSESSTQTIGGKYPFIKRNGNLNYRQIGISGLITYQMDIEEGYGIIKDSLSKPDLEWFSNEKNLFTSKSALLNGYDLAYEQFNADNRISAHRDFILERKFREAVTDFLLDGKPKLFRSPTEKAAIVRLMNVSTTPNAGLGRMLYNFSATAYEIADYNLANISKYKIEQLGGYTPVKGDEIVTQSSELRKSQTGLIDYFNEEDSNMVNLLNPENFSFPSSGIEWKNNLQYAINTKISLLQQGYGSAATPYPITSNGMEPILFDANNEDIGDEAPDTTGFILYYERYEPNSTPVMESIVIEDNEYIFDSSTPLSFLSFAVPSNQTIYAKVITDIVGYETSIDEEFILGAGV